jgi:redox-sensitive bicupin YhaK (pirin superfamily)
MVGPFIFFDQMGPASLAAGQGMDVRPHPHIGLSTVTYLFEGLVLHRDSLGNVQPITPGDVNWMTAGKGIVHSERSDPELRKKPQRIHGLQLWVALPTRLVVTHPAFVHYGAASLPLLEDVGVTGRVIAGSAFGTTSPVRTFSDLFYIDLSLEKGARLPLPAEYTERAIYPLAGKLEIDGTAYDAGQMLVLKEGAEVVIAALEPTRLVMIGGEPLDGPRHIWWNFVSSDPERIEAAKDDWRRDRFNAPIMGETEFIPLPEDF